MNAVSGSLPHSLLLLLVVAMVTVACSRGDGRADRARVSTDTPAEEAAAQPAAGEEPSAAAPGSAAPAPAPAPGAAAPAPGMEAPAPATGPAEALVPGSLRADDHDLLGDTGLTEELLAGWEQECEDGVADACSHAGWYGAIWGELRPYEPERARELFHRACEAGSGLGCSNLGFLHISNQLTDSDRELARNAFQRACDLGTGLGCSNLGWFVHSPDVGFDTDEARSRFLFGQACQLGAGLGCSNLAMAEFERGSPEADRSAAHALERGCALDNVDACNDLAWYVLLEGRGGQANSRRAVEVLTYACEAEQATSCGTLGSIYLEGIHAPQNLDSALGHFARACDLGSDYGCEMLGAITGR